MSYHPSAIRSEPSAVTFARQRADELVYRLVEGPAPRGLLRVLAERTIAAPWGEATLAIIGSSHFLEVSAAGETHTELLSSSRPGLGTLPVLERIDKGTGRCSRLLGGHLDYEFRMGLRKYRADEYVAETQGLTMEKPHRLLFEFPCGNGEHGAVTCLDWRVDGGQLVVETYHSYPGELSVVRSRTTIGVPERGIAP